MTRLWLAALLPLAPVLASAATPASGPLVLELFTSESCSSCPPADDLLADYARTRPDLLPLAFHVDYWNGLGWRDRFSLSAATQRQRGYAAALGAGVYTPQLVAGGRFQAVGSDRDAVEAAIRHAMQDRQQGPALKITTAGATVLVAVGAGHGDASVILIGFDNLHRTSVGNGENSGRTMTEANVVRSFADIGAWHGDAAGYRSARPPGERSAVLLQADDGRILAAGMTENVATAER